MTGPRLAAALLLAGWPAVSMAQTAPAAPPGEPKYELAVTLGLVGPVTFGSADATLTKPDGSPLVLFSTENSLATGFALEAHLGQQITPRLMVEASGAWQRADFQTKVSSDFEDVESTTVTGASSRFTVEGAVLWTLAERGRMDIFARGGVGWMRELAGSGAVVEDGYIGNAGGGVKYWWVERPTGRIRRLGLRVEGRLSIRSTGLTLGERKARAVPVVVGGIVFGF